MTKEIIFEAMDCRALARLAGLLAPMLGAGDVLALKGELGVGKTAFARLLIQALMGGDEEVPSPAFPLLQIYETPRLTVYHYDFYRLSKPAEALELGFDEAVEHGLAIIEWPERLGTHLPEHRLEITFRETSDPFSRQVTLAGHGPWEARLGRLSASMAFIQASGWEAAAITHMNGDASIKTFARLRRGGESAVLIDWPKRPDGPPIRHNRPYSQIAHLAEDSSPFIAIGAALRRAGLGAPAIYAQDLEGGFLLVEDLGDDGFTRLADAGADLAPLYRRAADVLIALRREPLSLELPIGNGGAYALPPYDGEALGIEAELLLDWFIPAATGNEAAASCRDEFTRLWDRHFAWLCGQRRGWVLRDYHSPNLIWRGEQQDLKQVGIIDFQDAVAGHPAYDLVSLLQDARLDMPPNLEETLFEHYCASVEQTEPDFARDDFAKAYALLGAQRNTKILGIFARLALRDNKRGYLQHIPRIANYLTSNLAHPALANLKAWYDHAIPHPLRSAPLAV